jgi:hypothetical protein
MSTPQLAKRNRHSYHRRLPPGRLIPGIEPAENWFTTILSGVIKVTTSLPNGPQQIVALLYRFGFRRPPFQGKQPPRTDT